MEYELHLSSRSAAALLAQIYGPAVDDTPQPKWYPLLLHPQPLPPRERRVMALADAYIKEFVRLDRLGTLLGGEAAERVTETALRMVAEVATLCPQWPAWPHGWSDPMDGSARARMTANELLVFGSFMLSASELIDLAPLRDALVELGENVLCLSMDDEQQSRMTKSRDSGQPAVRQRRTVTTSIAG